MQTSGATNLLKGVVKPNKARIEDWVMRGKDYAEWGGLLVSDALNILTSHIGAEALVHALTLTYANNDNLPNERLKYDYLTQRYVRDTTEQYPTKIRQDKGIKKNTHATHFILACATPAGKISFPICHGGISQLKRKPKISATTFLTRKQIPSRTF